MAKGIKTGGRKKGTPNKDKECIRDKIEGMGVYPLEMIAEIAKTYHDLGDYDRAIVAAKELAPYMYPKLKTIEHTGGTDDTLDAKFTTININPKKAKKATDGGS